MTRTELVRRAGILLATAALLLACGLGRWWPGATATLALGLLTWLGAERRWAGTGALFLMGVTGLVTLGTLNQLPSFLLLIALLGALAAWDLVRFEQRLREAPHDDARLALEQRHLTRLLTVLALGGAASIAALTIQVSLGFGLTLVLGMALVILLGQTLRQLIC